MELGLGEVLRAVHGDLEPVLLRVRDDVGEVDGGRVGFVLRTRQPAPDPALLGLKR